VGLHTNCHDPSLHPATCLGATTDGCSHDGISQRTEECGVGAIPPIASVAPTTQAYSHCRWPDPVSHSTSTLGTGAVWLLTRHSTSSEATGIDTIASGRETRADVGDRSTLATLPGTARHNLRHLLTRHTTHEYSVVPRSYTAQPEKEKCLLLTPDPGG
jgi:hypothetical protein